jgi:hypothetical protein
MNLQTLHPDFRDFLRLLNEAKVEYLLIGGYAVGFYGYVRFTADIGVWIAVNPANAERLRVALTEFGFASDAKHLVVELGDVFRMGVPPYKIEICTKIDGVEFAECYSQRVMVEVNGLEIPVIDLANLRKNKAASGRPKDLADLAGLPEVHKDNP